MTDPLSLRLIGALLMHIPQHLKANLHASRIFCRVAALSYNIKAYKIVRNCVQ